MRKIAGYLTKNRSGKDQKIAQSTQAKKNFLEKFKTASYVANYSQKQFQRA